MTPTLCAKGETRLGAKGETPSGAKGEKVLQN
jgi:hypothetical protein